MSKAKSGNISTKRCNTFSRPKVHHSELWLVACANVATRSKKLLLLMPRRRLRGPPHGGLLSRVQMLEKASVGSVRYWLRGFPEDRNWNREFSESTEEACRDPRKRSSEARDILPDNLLGGLLVLGALWHVMRRRTRVTCTGHLSRKVPVVVSIYLALCGQELQMLQARVVVFSACATEKCDSRLVRCQEHGARSCCEAHKVAEGTRFACL